MMEGFENAFDAFIERQKEQDAIRERLYGINGQRDAELEAVEQKIYKILQNIEDRDNAHRETLPPEAFQGYGGQTPQYEDNYHYGATEKEEKELDALFKEYSKIESKYVNKECIQNHHLLKS